MKSIAWPCLLACLLFAGCDRSPAPSGMGPAGTAVLPPDSVVVDTPNSERVWAGLLPCSDCQGVDTRLVLRANGGKHDFLMTETYLGGSGRNSFNTAGSWIEISTRVMGEPMTMFILDPEKASQRFSLQPDGALEVLDGDGKEPLQSVANRLQRL